MTANIELKDDLPSITPAGAKSVMQNYKAICAAMLDESDYSTISGKKHKNKSAWRKLARAFQISDEIIKEEKTDTAWRIQVRAYTVTGRSAVGIGACSSKERAFAHPDHDIYATAHTRAKNRAISDLIGVGETSAEEIESETASIEKVFEGRLDGKTR